MTTQITLSKYEIHELVFACDAHQRAIYKDEMERHGEITPYWQSKLNVLELAVSKLCASDPSDTFLQSMKPKSE